MNDVNGGKIYKMIQIKIDFLSLRQFDIYYIDMDLEYNPANKKVAYFYNPIISKFVYAKEHPMRP